MSFCPRTLFYFINSDENVIFKVITVIITYAPLIKPLINLSIYLFIYPSIYQIAFEICATHGELNRISAEEQNHLHLTFKNRIENIVSKYSIKKDV